MQLIKAFADKYLEDPRNPLLGPTLKGLYMIGLWRVGSQIQIVVSNTVISALTLFHVSQWINLVLSILYDDLPTITDSMYTTTTVTISLFKILTMVYWQKDWKRLIEGVAYEETLEKSKADPDGVKITKEYTLYARKMYFGYSCLLIMSLILLVVTPIIDLAFSPGYRAAIRNGTEPYPQYVAAWYPFDNTKPPGYIPAVMTQLLTSTYLSMVIMLFDLNAVTHMVFFKGHIMILKNKFKKLFDEVNGELSREMVVERVKECHRHYTHLVELKNLLNSLLSPVMFLYLLICIIAICSTVMQFSLGEGQTSDKLYKLSFATTLVLQLLFYCWHSTEVIYESEAVDRGIYDSDWWRADVRSRKDLLLLGGQASKAFQFDAGPFATLSNATFVEILKATYSFYTFLTQK